MSQPDYNQQQQGFPQAQYPPPGGQYPPPGYGQPGQPVQMQPVAGYPPGQPGQPMGYAQPGQQMGYAPPGQPYSNMPVMQQPGQNMWMPMPQGIPNCPPGLEYLTMIDQILVHQQIEIFELMSGVEGANKYRVKNNMGQDVYFAAEDSDFCSRNCFGSQRPFDMKIIDNTGREVIHMYRPCRCDSCCYPCCLQKLEVSAPVGEVIGYVVQEWSMCPSFSIQNANQETILRISGPCCVGCGCSDVNFHVLALDGVTKVGKIQKQWTGFMQEAYSDADNFGITFPMDLDVRMKAVMLGACFLIDFMYFESKQGGRK